MSKLMLHTGSRSASRELVVATPTPQRTHTWVPIAHSRLLDGVQSTLERSGLTVVEEAHGLSRDGARYFGLLKIRDQEHIEEDSSLVIGLRNSHDQSFPAGLVLGSSVTVCDNLSFSGSVRLARKHTARVEYDLPQLIERAVGQLGDLRRSQAARFSCYKSHELNHAGAHDLLVRALDVGVIPVTKLPLAIAEWRTPRHRDFMEGGLTAWRLFNAVTEALKGNIDLLPRRTQALHGLLDAACDLVLAV